MPNDRPGSEPFVAERRVPPGTAPVGGHRILGVLGACSTSSRTSSPAAVPKAPLWRRRLVQALWLLLASACLPLGRSAWSWWQ